MHVYLQKHTISKWRNKFQVEDSVWQQYLHNPEDEKEIIPPWFLFVSRWFMHGLNGPFGSVSKIPIVFLPENTKALPGIKLHYVPNLFPNNQSISFIQNDTSNCGICCQLFKLDLIITQHNISWKASKNPDGSLPDHIKLGSSIIAEDKYRELPNSNFNLQNHLDFLYQLFWEEFVVLMERLCYLYVDNFFGINGFNFDKNWGSVSPSLLFLKRKYCNHFSGDFTPNSKLFLQAYEQMKDNEY